MKSYNSILIFSICLTVSIFISLDVCAGDAGSFRAGAAAVDITPKDFPVNMPGGFTANMAETVHDPLHSRALVLSNGVTTLAMVVVDSLGIGRETTAEAKSIASTRCGIAPEKILISATHTHSAPTSGSTNGPPQAVAYRKILVEGIAESIVRAHRALRPAAVGVATHPMPEEVFNRRWFLKPGKMTPNPFGKMDQVKTNPGTSPDVIERPAGPTDPDITVISLQDAKRKPLALYANYSLHYVGGVPRAVVSADYYGEFARIMPFRMRAGDDFVAMMSNGTSGDINNIPFLVTRPPREPFEQICIIARKAADAAWHAQARITSYDAKAQLGMIQREVTLRLRCPTAEQVAEARAVLAVKDEAERAKLPRLSDHYARNIVAAFERPDKTLTIILQAIRIGDLGVCGIPFETFVEIGLELKKRSPFPRTMVIGLANARHDYLPTPEQHKLGGYETFLGTCKVQEDASVIIINNLLEMLAELRK
ncbi:MAG: neutral/alkaline non-lysosomal ceramidase N-terminal domain-containing protein [Kiritimatiellae bacterium]|nr:neutral/alkaline non-lysosomal ceramidase N-terminal domain-containing protein [Kiritimatiellia bacterium]MDD5522794.1 neutral/alkaline non-lysosomal ceramidase N-terminal domain-containing protein [Kiritimatiellia bacterium]